MKKFISIILILFTLFTLVSCSDEKNPEETTPSNTDEETGKESVSESSSSSKNTEDVVIANGKLSYYTIIYPKGSDEEEALAKKIADLIKKETGVMLSCKSDAYKISDYEILVGKTNREESSTALTSKGNNDYVAIVLNRKLAFCLSEYDEDLQTLFIDRLEDIFKENKTDSKTLAFAWNFRVVDNRGTYELLSKSFNANTRVSFDFELTHEKSNVAFRVGTDTKNVFKGLELSVNSEGLRILSYGTTKTELGKKAYNFNVGKKYSIVCDFDGQYAQVYISESQNIAGIDARWPDFAVKTSALSVSAYIGEASGYGAIYKIL